MAKSFMILIVALMAVLQLVACQEKLAEAEGNDLSKDGDSSASSGDKAGLVPIVLVRGQDDKPDFFLLWWKPYEHLIPKPMMDIINSQVRPQTQQITGQLIDNMPGADQVWSQMSQVQNIVNQLGLANMIPGGSGGSGGSGGENPLSGLFGRRRR